MKAQEFEALIPDYVLGKLTQSQDEAFGKYLNEHPNALDQWNALKNELEHSFEPSAKMDATFYNFLNAETNKDQTPKVVQLETNSKPSIFKKFLPLIAASVMLLLGFFIGKESQPKVVEPAYNVTEVETMKNETNAVRTELVMTLADESSASKRLQAVSEASKLNNATEKVILALFKMLNTDTNVNVRLAAVSSLSKYVDNPIVREGLILSITKQESPLVQIALAELMVTLKEQKSINSMETLLQKPDINSAVKQKLEESIKQII